VTHFKQQDAMKRRYVFPTLIIFCAVLTLTFSTAHAGKKKELFPQLPGWELEIGDKVYNPGNLWNIINGAADSYLSYDFQKLYTAEYIKGNDRRMTVYIYEHSSPTNAFGIYSQERSSDYTFVNTGAQGFKSQDAYYFIKGPFYVQISTSSQDLASDLKTVAEKIAQQIDHPGELPDILKLFPKDGLLENSERYISQNFLGYSYLHSAFTANYERDGQSFQLFIIHPDEPDAIQPMLARYLDFAEYPKDGRGKEVLKIEDPYNGTLWIYQHSQYLAGVIGTGGEMADKYIGMLKERLK